jgi:hypothetical protein
MYRVPDPLLLRKSGSAGNRTRDLWICRQELWTLDRRGGSILISWLYTNLNGLRAWRILLESRTFRVRFLIGSFDFFKLTWSFQPSCVPRVGSVCSRTECREPSLVGRGKAWTAPKVHCLESAEASVSQRSVGLHGFTYSTLHLHACSSPDFRDVAGKSAKCYCIKFSRLGHCTTCRRNVLPPSSGYIVNTLSTR